MACKVSVIVQWISFVTDSTVSVENNFVCTRDLVFYCPEFLLTNSFMIIVICIVCSNEGEFDVILEIDEIQLINLGLEISYSMLVQI